MKTTFARYSSAFVAATMIALTGCAATPSETSSPAPADASITVKDLWVKAADKGMSAGFGAIKNTSGQDITIASVSSPVSSDLELHETVANESGAMVMREKSGGFTIPAHSELQLEPGGNHIMFMDLAKPLTSGSDVSITLTFSDHTTLDITAPVKDFAGANENYEGSDHQGMDHGDMKMDH
ncbi:copper chaperone PCu(A)C [Glutamicibacter sp. 287]|uniref:copper chaperone PCu(A)C n=1 Tax=unclassified Glutamicibacter TaxID=2627139 RepID=UPI0040334E8C